ncbi:uncharacterized protein LOC143614957 [Bidens hawaiensis]|uniref:uncharacterized protein LOC143614957 n=1 Tax=Bidens hawaiensis TaxID=980011 RepID=UPI0040499580
MADRYIEGDGVLDLYEHLRFDQQSDYQIRFTQLRRMEPKPNSFLSTEFISLVRAENMLQRIVGKDTPWERLFTAKDPAYRVLKLEFYSTFVFRPRPEGDLQVPMLVEDADTSKAEVRFRMLGILHNLSMEEFAIALGLYTTEDITAPVYTQSIHESPDDVLRCFWTAISDTPWPIKNGQFEPDAKASSIRDPLHRLIAHTVQGRHGVQNTATSVTCFICDACLRGDTAT